MNHLAGANKSAPINQTIVFAPELQGIKGLVHGFTTKAAGNMALRFGDSEDTTRNRLAIFSQIGIDPEKVCYMELQHTDEIKIVSEHDLGKPVTADGLICAKEDVYLFLSTADCLPIIITEPSQKIVALIHAGWKGTQDLICEKAIKLLSSEFGCLPANLIVSIGPCIRAQSYWFPVEDCQQINDSRWQPFLYCYSNSPGRVYIDVLGFNRAQLANGGIPTQNIFISDEDTYGSDLFYSHRHWDRVGGEEGRFATVAGYRGTSQVT